MVLCSQLNATGRGTSGHHGFRNTTKEDEDEGTLELQHVLREGVGGERATRNRESTFGSAPIRRAASQQHPEDRQSGARGGPRVGSQGEATDQARPSASNPSWSKKTQHPRQEPDRRSTTAPARTTPAPHKKPAQRSTTAPACTPRAPQKQEQDPTPEPKPRARNPGLQALEIGATVTTTPAPMAGGRASSSTS